MQTNTHTLQFSQFGNMKNGWIDGFSFEKFYFSIFKLFVVIAVVAVVVLGCCSFAVSPNQ